MGIWRGLRKKRSEKQGRKGNIYPTKHRFPKNSTDRQKGLLQWTVYKTRKKKKKQKGKDWRFLQVNGDVKGTFYTSAKSLSCLRLFATLWMVACQAPLYVGILQARALELVSIPFSRGSSQLRDPTCISYISCIGGFFTTSATWEARGEGNSKNKVFQGKKLEQREVPIHWGESQ